MGVAKNKQLGRVENRIFQMFCRIPRELGDLGILRSIHTKPERSPLKGSLFGASHIQTANSCWSRNQEECKGSHFGFGRSTSFHENHELRASSGFSGPLWATWTTRP